LKKHSITI